MPECLCKTLCTCDFFLREDPFQQVTKKIQDATEVKTLLTSVKSPSHLLQEAMFLPNYGSPSIGLSINKRTLPFKAG